MTRIRARRWALALALCATACSSSDEGGSNQPPTTPSPPSTPGPPAPLPTTATINISAAGTNPKEVQIAVGGTVTFNNNDERLHIISSDPIDIHTDCPVLNEVGLIVAGQTRTTRAFDTERRCGFHDHADEFNAALKGTIIVGRPN
jgi:plastocyanin